MTISLIDGEVLKDGEWICGHTAGAVCAECWRILAQHASDLALENQRLKERVRHLHGRLGEKYL